MSTSLRYRYVLIRLGLMISLFMLMNPCPLVLSQVHAAEAKIYDSPNGIQASPHYEVLVEVDGQWKSAFVYYDPAREDGSGARDEAGKSFSWTTFESNMPVRIRVRRLLGAFKSVTLRPQRYQLTANTIEEDVIEFIADPGQKISVEFSNEIKPSCYTGPPHGIPCLKNSMLVFVDKLKAKSAIADYPENEVFTVSSGVHEELQAVSGIQNRQAGKSTIGNCDGKKVVHFPPGVYDIGYWQVPNNIEHIHIEGGALVYGAIDVIPLGREPFYDPATIDHVYRDDWRGEELREEFSITGSGIISGAKLPWHLKKDFSYTSNDDWWAHVKLIQLAVKQVRVEDITIANSPHWVLSFINDADRRTRGSFDNFKMVGAWTYNNDGLPTATGEESYIRNAFIHADDDAFKIYNSGSKIENCVIWQSNNGAVFQFGWFPKTVNNVTVSNIDVIHFENWYGVGQSNRAVFNYANSGGNGTISNIEFNNINIEGPVLRLFGFNCFGNQIIKDITFNNLNVPGGMGVGNLGSPGANYFIGAISDFEFNNFTFGDVRVAASAQAQFEFGNGAGAGFIFQSEGPPSVNAGPNKTITLPQSSTSLVGSVVDHDGEIIDFNWSQIDGPKEAILLDKNKLILEISGLVEGTYVFRLSAKDNEDQMAFDEATVQVLPEPPPQSPVADAGKDQFIVLPQSSAELQGVAVDEGGVIERVEWNQISGPENTHWSSKSSSLVQVSGLLEGEYVFRFTVFDDDRMSSFDDVSVKVFPIGTIISKEVLWGRGAGNSNLSQSDNWVGGEAPGPLDIACLKAPKVTDSNYNLDTDHLHWGALKVGMNQSSFWNFNSQGNNSTASIVFSGQDIDTFKNAAIVNQSGQGGGLRFNIILSGGGAFIIAHNSGSGLEIDGALKETGGAASLIVDGNGISGTGQGRVHIRGSNTSESIYQLTGSIKVQNGANLRIEGGFDISKTGGTITVDKKSKWNLGPSVSYKTAGLSIGGVTFPPGVYSKEDFEEAGVGGNIENSGGKIEVVSVKKESAFIRGDCNDDGVVDFADPIQTLMVLFRPKELLELPGCYKAMDGNDDGKINLSDSVFLLFSLFVENFPDPPPPFPHCGLDPTLDAVACLQVSSCVVEIIKAKAQIVVE